LQGEKALADNHSAKGCCFIKKSLLTSLWQREGLFPSLAKRGEGRFYEYFQTVTEGILWQEEDDLDHSRLLGNLLY